MNSINWPSVFGYTLFCDDIRQEVNGKVTLVGVYGGEMTVFADLPTLLPKLALAVNYYETPDQTEEHLELLIFFPGDSEDAPTSRAKVPSEAIAELRKSGQIAALPAEDQRVGITMHVVFSPVTVKEDGFVRVRMARGQDVIRLGSLRIRSQVPSDQPSTPTQNRTASDP